MTPYLVALHEYQEARKALNAKISSLEDRQYVCTSDDLGHIDCVTYARGILLIHYNDDAYSVFRAKLNFDEDPIIGQDTTRLSESEMVAHGLLEKADTDLIQELRERVDEENAKIAEWGAFVHLAEKFGVLVPDQTVEV